MRPRRSRRGLALAGAAVGALALILAIAIPVAIATQSDGNDPGDDTRTTPPQAEEIDCWDGTTASTVSACPQPTGLAGLDWTFDFEGGDPTCTRADATGDLTDHWDCTWADKPDISVYMADYAQVGWSPKEVREAWIESWDYEATHREGYFRNAGDPHSYLVYYTGPDSYFVMLDDAPLLLSISAAQPPRPSRRFTKSSIRLWSTTEQGR